MKEMDATSYENVSVAESPPSTNVNLGFTLDEDLDTTPKQLTPPIIETHNLTASQQLQLISFPPLTVEEIKRACHFYAAPKCCYGTAFVENMTILDVSDRVAYQYTLESFCEKRETAEQTKPYHGGHVDGADCGPTLRPWDVPVSPSENFKEERKVVEIPHTSYIKPCMKCKGVGNTSCKWCFGVGGRGCVLCLSSKKYRPCTNCKYSSRRCLFCDGKGTEKCKTCEGQGKLRAYNILIATWAIHADHFVTDTMSLPAEEIRTAKGRHIFSEEAEELSPAWNVPNTSVVAASTSLISKHKTGFISEAMKRQRHTFRAVPFTHIKYRWREDIGEFYVYGLEKKAYFENYPQEYCCCCILM